MDVQRDHNKSRRSNHRRNRKGTTSLKSRLKARRKPKIDPKRSYVGITEHPNAVPWKVKDCTSLPKPMAWIKRESSRFIGHIGPYSRFKVPYLDHLGRNTGEHLYDWVTTLQNFCASYVATKSKRLRENIYKTKSLKKSRRRKLYNVSCKVAALSFITGSNYLIERLKALFCKKGCTQIINAMIRKFISKLDDNKWFVYRHISSQIQWLDLRVSSKTGPRDKSKIHDSALLLAEKLGRSNTVSLVGVYQTLHQISTETGLYVR